jgi:hypothetical protein
MGGLGQAMISRKTAAPAVALLILALAAVGGSAGGLNLGCEIVTLDVAGTLPRVPVAFHAASDELLAMLSAQGMPPDELVALASDFDTAIADLNANLTTFPSLLPVPLLGAGFEIPLPFVIVDGVRIFGGTLNGAIVRSIADAAGVEIPDPVVDESFNVDGETARFTLDAEVSAWSVSVEAVKRFDLLLGAVNLSAGIDVAGGAVTLDVGRELPAGWVDGVDAALAALHLGDVRWSAFAAHVGARLELGLPFLRLYAEARLMQPIAEWVGWWDLHAGGLAGSVGVVIRF